MIAVVPLRTVVPRLLITALLLAVALVPSAPFPVSVYAAGVCTVRQDNMTRNGSVTDGGYDTPHGVVANSWNPFLMGGDWPEYNLADNESANGDLSGSSSQYIHGDLVHFDAGIYQVVSGTTPGASYEFSVGWAAMLRDTGGGHNTKPDNAVVRMVGVDPTGGVDPNSPNVQWGGKLTTGSSGRSLNSDVMDLTFKAKSNQVTVFIRAFDNGQAPSDKVFLDVMCMLPRGDIPVDTSDLTPTATPPPPATATSEVPPTPRNTRVPPTKTSVPTATPIPATNIPAHFSTATPGTQESISQAPPRATIQLVAQARGGGSATDGGSSSGDAGSGGGGNTLSLAVIAGSVGIIGISLLGVLAIGGFVVWRVFMRQVDDALDPNYSPEDDYYQQ